MGITVVRQFSNKNEIRYLVEHDGDGGGGGEEIGRAARGSGTSGDDVVRIKEEFDEITIANKGGASPDLATDARGGLLKSIVTARSNGYGCCPPGPLDQEKARALLFGMDPNNIFGTENIVRADVKLTTIEGYPDWTVDADADEQGNPILKVKKFSFDAGSALLVIRAPASPGA